MTPPSVGVFHNHVTFIPIPVHKQQQETCDEKENAVHDAECKAGFQHRTCLVRVHRDWAAGAATCAIAIDAEACTEIGIGAERGAVGIGNEPQLVDPCNEGTNEAEVNKRHEDGRFTGRFPAEKGDDCPHASEHRDDEENEDGGGCELVLRIVNVDKVGLLLVSTYGTIARVHKLKLTSMPSVGMRVMISKLRQNQNTNPRIMMTVGKRISRPTSAQRILGSVPHEAFRMV